MSETMAHVTHQYGYILEYHLSFFFERGVGAEKEGEEES